MPDENQGPDARQDLNIKDLGSHKNDSSKPTSDSSSIQSVHMILKLFSRYNNKITQLERKMKSLESELEADPLESSVNSTDPLFLSEQDGKEDQDSQKDEHWPDGRPSYNPWSAIP